MADDKKCKILNSILALLRDNDSESSSDSDSSTEELLVSVVATVQRLSENITLEYTTEQFIFLYRVHPTLFLSLVTKYRESVFYRPAPQQGGGRPSIPPEKQILIFLWYAGQRKASGRHISNQFDVGLNRSCVILHRVASFLGTLSVEAITWQDRQQNEDARTLYQERSGIHNIIGCMDVLQVGIPAPRVTADMYINVEQAHSIQVQGICDYRLKFLDVFVGFPGSVEPSQVLQSSFIYSKLPELCKDNCLVGNSCYEMTPWLLVPYKETELTDMQQNFNMSLLNVYSDVQRTFHLLMVRFPCLEYLHIRQLKTACEVIMACCVLHNLSNSEDLKWIAEASSESDKATETLLLNRGYNSDDEMQDSCLTVASGFEIRNSIAQTLLLTSGGHLLMSDSESDQC